MEKSHVLGGKYCLIEHYSLPDVRYSLSVTQENMLMEIWLVRVDEVTAFLTKKNNNNTLYTQKYKSPHWTSAIQNTF